MAKALPPSDDAPPKKKSRFKLIMLLCSLVLLLSALGGGGYWWLYMRPGSEGLAGLFGSSEETVQTDAAAGQAAASGSEGQSAGEKSAASAEHGSGTSATGDKSSKPRTAIKPVSLPTLTVNLADPSGQRYLNIGMDVELNSPEAVAELEGQTARIRDAIILLLSSKKVADLATAEGKILLKTEVAARLNQILGAQRVVRIYFTEFVMR